jgi:hypothetical protein
MLHCNDANCSGSGESITSPDPGGGWSAFTSLELDAAGNPVVSYLDSFDNSNNDLKVLHCNDANCAGSDESIALPDAAYGVGRYTSLALDMAGNPVVSYHDFANNLDLKLLHCGDPICKATTPSTPTGTPTNTATHTPTPPPTPTPTPPAVGGLAIEPPAPARTHFDTRLLWLLLVPSAMSAVAGARLARRRF